MKDIFVTVLYVIFANNLWILSSSTKWYFRTRCKGNVRSGLWALTSSEYEKIVEPFYQRIYWVCDENAENVQVFDILISPPARSELQLIMIFVSPSHPSSLAITGSILSITWIIFAVHRGKPVYCIIGINSCLWNMSILNLKSPNWDLTLGDFGFVLSLIEFELI